MRLTLVRHAHSVSNEIGALSSIVPGPELSKAGEESLMLLSASIGAATLRPIWASAAQRARRTAQIITSQAAQSIDGLMEVDAGRYEGRSDPEAIERYFDVVKSWMHGELATSLSGASGDGFEFLDGFDSAIKRVCASEPHPVVITHGTAMRVWAKLRTDAVSAEEALRRRIPHLGSIQLEWANERWRLLTWGKVVASRDLFALNHLGQRA